MSIRLAKKSKLYSDHIPGPKKELRLGKASGHDRRINTSDVILKNTEDKERKDELIIYLQRYKRCTLYVDKACFNQRAM